MRKRNSTLYIAATAVLIAGLLLGLPFGWALFVLCLAACLHRDFTRRAASSDGGGSSAEAGRPGLPEGETDASGAAVRPPAGARGRAPRFTAVRRVLFGPAHISPLSRKAFLRTWPEVLLVRGGLLVCLGVPLMFWVGDPAGLSEEELLNGRVMIALPATLLLALCFLVPYFRVMQKRLVGLGSSLSRTLTFLAAVFLVAADYLFHDLLPFAAMLYVDIVTLGMHFCVYALLLPWPDRLNRDQTAAMAR